MRVLVRAGATFSCRKSPLRKGLLSYLPATVSLGTTNCKTVQTNLGAASSDAIPIRRQAIFRQGFGCQTTSESNNIQATVTRQPHTSHVLPSIERIDSIPSRDSRNLEATDSLSNAVCFEWPATTRFRARYRGSADSINPTDGKRRKQFLLSALLCAFRFYRPLGRDKGNQIVSIVTRCNSIQVVIDRFVADTHTVRIDSKTLEAGANTRKGQ